MLMMMLGRSECGEEQFQCGDTGQCLDPEYQCDGVQDCQDGSGEYSTVQYSIVQYSHSTVQYSTTQNCLVSWSGFHLGPHTSFLFLIISKATSL